VSELRAASRTAVLVCQARAAADGRLAPGVFADPIAYDLLLPDERTVVDEVRAGAVPPGWAARVAYESVSACAEVIVPRTVAIDEALREHPHPQLVILGAGLDTRAWRLRELADVDVTELDHAASQRDKQERVGDRPTYARTHRFQPADLAVDDLSGALDAAGHDPEAPTTWLWEGVIPYLRRADVVRTLAAVAARSARGSTLVVNYQTPSLRARSGRVAAAVFARLGGAKTITAGEAWHTLLTPRDAVRLLADAGFGVQSDEDLATIADDLGMPTMNTTSLRNGRIAVAVRH
jgi:methyltransferase (TIGR00027 family)